MQEHRPYNITPDQGWGKMKSILDETMPVKPQRRYPFLWWTASGVVVISLMGFLLLQGDTKSSGQHTTSNTEAAAPQSNNNEVKGIELNEPFAPTHEGNETKSAPVSNTSNILNLKSADRTKTQQSAKSTKSNSSKPIQSTEKPNTDNKKNVDVPMAMSVNPETGISEIASVDMAITNPSVDVNTTPQNVSSNQRLDLIEAPALRNIQALDFLPSLSSQSITSPIDYENEIIPGGHTKGKRNPNFIEPTLAVSGLAGWNGGLGASGAAGVNFNVSKRLGFTTTLGYMTYSPNANLVGTKKSLDNNSEYNSIVNYDPSFIGNEVYVDAQNVNSQVGYNAINPLVDKVTQWQVTTGVKWRVSPRFFTEGGLQFGFNTQAYSQYPIISFEPGTSQPYSKINNALNDFEVVRSTTTSAYLGLGYRVSPHLDIYSNWTHGFQSYLLNETVDFSSGDQIEERTDYIRGLTVGLRYTL